MPAHLLAVAVNAPQGQSVLHFAEDDAGRIARLFTSAHGRVEPQDAKQLLGANATIATLRAALHLLRLGQPEHLVIYWCGHGNEYGIALMDGLFSYQELGAWLEAIPSRTRTVILNTCHAGAAWPVIATTGGIGGALELAWADALRRAVPGLRLLAAVSATELAHEDYTIKGTRYTHALLKALRRSRGDIEIDGYRFVSDVAAHQAARQILRKKWPREPTPALWGPDIRHGSLPLVLSQAEQPIGGVAITGIEQREQLAVALVLQSFGRRGVHTRVEWKLVDELERILHTGTACFEPAADETCERLALVAPNAILTQNPLYGLRLRRGEVLHLRWVVEVKDDHGHLLDASEEWLSYCASPPPAVFSY